MNKVTFQTIKDASVIKPVGEMTFFFLEELNKYLTEEIKKNQFRFVFDMTEVSWVDSIGLGLIAGAVKAAMSNHSKICMVRPRPNVEELLRMGSLIEFIELFDSVDDAVKYFHS